MLIEWSFLLLRRKSRFVACLLHADPFTERPHALNGDHFLEIHKCEPAALPLLMFPELSSSPD